MSSLADIFLTGVTDFADACACHFSVLLCSAGVAFHPLFFCALVSCSCFHGTQEASFLPMWLFWVCVRVAGHAQFSWKSTDVEHIS
jgi:hypothetical protein